MHTAEVYVIVLLQDPTAEDGNEVYASIYIWGRGREGGWSTFNERSTLKYETEKRERMKEEMNARNVGASTMRVEMDEATSIEGDR